MQLSKKDLINNFFLLIRWYNSFLAVLPLVAIYGLIIIQASNDKIFCYTPPLWFGILCISIILLMAGGFVINDIYDRKIDATNRPKKVLINRIFSVKTGYLIYAILNILGISLALLVSINSDVFKWFFVYLSIMGVLMIYSLFLKQRPLIGNITIAGLSALLPLVILFFEDDCITKFTSSKVIYSLIYCYSFFTFNIMIIREIVCDIEDLEGDFQAGCKTLVITLGIYKTKFVLYALSAALLIFLIYLSIKFDYFTPVSVFICLLLIFTNYKLVISKEKKDFSDIRGLLKTIIIVGLIGFLAVCYVEIK